MRLGYVKLGSILKMISKDPKEHIRKASDPYPYFWLSYKGSLIKLLTVQGERDGREREVILGVAYPEAEVGLGQLNISIRQS